MSTSTKQYGETGVIHTGSGNTCHVYVPDWNGGGLSGRDLTPDTIARFQAKYTKSEGCWLWQASRFPKGYGQFVLARTEYGQPRAYAHRVAYVLAHGDIPPGLVVMHKCDTPACVNPAHLVLGTQADNLADAMAKGRMGGFTRPDIQKITDAQVHEIRASTEPGVVLAKRYGVSKSCISLIRRGLARKAA